MEEQSVLRKHFIMHIVYNMIAFSFVFIIFGVFVFFMVRNITFSSVDKELIEAQNQFFNINERLEMMYKLFDIENYSVLDSTFNNFSDYNITKRIDNPQIGLVLRDKNGEILNQNDLGRMLDYISKIEFDSKKMDTIYNLKLGEKYNYRCLNFCLKSPETYQERYVQLLINVDSEIVLVNNYMKIISYALIFGIMLSGIASYILSNKALKPVQDILKKQTEFVENASHELRTPLTIIQAKQELLLQEPNSKIIDKSEDIMLTLSETKRLSKLTKDLMILVRGTNLKLQKEDINIDEFIKNVIIPYKEIATAQEKELSLDLNFKKDISIDTSKIHQLLIILLDNAIKYTEIGDKIQISTIFKDNKFILEVADTGIGITDEGINRIFERFYREDRARNRETGGSGLGLSIANMIVKAHSGTIKASHNESKGTVFTVKLVR